MKRKSFCGKLLKRWEYQTILSVPWETCLRVKKQQLECYVEQQSGSGLRKYDKVTTEFSTVCYDPHKGFSVVDETEVDVFLKFPCFLCDPANVGNLISGSSTFSKPSLDIWKFLVRIILRPSIQDFKYDLTSVGCCSVAQSCLTLCDPTDSNTLGFPVPHHLPELAQTHIHWVGDPSNHLILCHPLLLLPSMLPSIRVFSNELALCIRCSKCWSFSFSINPSNEYSGLISFRIDWFDLLTA